MSSRRRVYGGMLGVDGFYVGMFSTPYYGGGMTYVSVKSNEMDNWNSNGAPIPDFQCVISCSSPSNSATFPVFTINKSGITPKYSSSGDAYDKYAVSSRINDTFTFTFNVDISGLGDNQILIAAIGNSDTSSNSYNGSYADLIRYIRTDNYLGGGSYSPSYLLGFMATENGSFTKQISYTCNNTSSYTAYLLTSDNQVGCYINSWYY